MIAPPPAVAVTVCHGKFRLRFFHLLLHLLQLLHHASLPAAHLRSFVKSFSH
ncbi:MAG: hypothetical protein MZV64_19145 [Ignavibacteriales bacterium]|nr:hypothetical protein [Ignavibacteriales bacterium]